MQDNGTELFWFSNYLNFFGNAFLSFIIIVSVAAPAASLFPRASLSSPALSPSSKLFANANVG